MTNMNTSTAVRAITQREYEALKAETPWDKSAMSLDQYRTEALGARRERIEGRIVAGGKIHALHAYVVTHNGEELVIDAYQTCGSGRRGFKYSISVGGDGERCGKCFDKV